MQSRTLALAISFIVAAEACCCCTALGGPEPPYAITPSQAAIDQFSARMEQPHVAAGDDGLVYFSIYMTEEEATSLLVDRLRAQEQAAPIERPQIHFREGRIEVYPTLAISEQFPLPIMVALSSVATADGITLTLAEIVVGPLPVPQAIVGGLGDMVSDTVSDVIADRIEPAAITDLQIDEGRLVLFLRADPDDL